MSDWNTTQYMKFGNERTQPAIDLINRINIKNPQKIIDIGCGPGNSTVALRDYFTDAHIIGVDNSSNMIDKAKKNYSDLTFAMCDASCDLATMDKDYDIVFSNACIQWIPNHPKLLKEMIGMLKPGGCLAIQVPINNNAPLYQIIDEVVSDEKWGFDKRNLEINETLHPDEYYDILSGLASNFSIWETTYYHQMGTHKDLVEWVKGTRLRPYLNVLSDEQKIAFENEIIEKASKVYPIQVNGTIIFRFRRLFFMAEA